MTKEEAVLFIREFLLKNGLAERHDMPITDFSSLWDSMADKSTGKILVRAGGEFLKLFI